MEITVPDLAGSLGGGGRYDGLIGMFSGENIPACGFSLGLERILVVMTERQMFPAGVQSLGPDVLVTIFDEQSAPESLKLASDLRREGLRVELYPEADKLGKQFKYASARNAGFVAILGSDEVARGEVTIKDMRSGQQTSLRRADVTLHLHRLRQDVESRTPDVGPRTSNLDTR
jgi:histidyl-tRNA synthetase